MLSSYFLTLNFFLECPFLLLFLILVLWIRVMFNLQTGSNIRSKFFCMHCKSEPKLQFILVYAAPFTTVSPWVNWYFQSLYTWVRISPELVSYNNLSNLTEGTDQERLFWWFTSWEKEITESGWKQLVYHSFIYLT